MPAFIPIYLFRLGERERVGLCFDFLRCKNSEMFCQWRKGCRWRSILWECQSVLFDYVKWLFRRTFWPFPVTGIELRDSFVILWWVCAAFVLSKKKRRGAGGNVNMWVCVIGFIGFAMSFQCSRFSLKYLLSSLTAKCLLLWKELK